MVADNSCEHETTGRQEGPQKPKIRCCNGEKIQGEALVAGVQKVIGHPEPKLGGGRVPQLEKEVVKDLIQLPQPRKLCHEVGGGTTSDLIKFATSPNQLKVSHQCLSAVSDA